MTRVDTSTAMQEVARRQKLAELRARRVAAGPCGLAAQFDKNWQTPPHLAALNKLLVRTATEPVRAVIAMPPRHGKSETCSKWEPTWFLSLFPDRHVLLASYEADYAARWGRKVRNLVDEFGDRLGFRLADDSTAASRWNTDRGGSMETAGVGGALTGKGAHLLIVDDPLKNSQDANSEVIRQRIWEWWTSTALTRLEPGASVILIQTRWHEDDLAGRVLALADATGQKWEVLEFPAIAEHGDELGRKEGEALWPERYSVDDLDAIRRTDERVWQALYQQQPSSPKGAILQRDWWKTYELPPLRKDFDELIQSWDLSFKDTDGSDLVCGLVMGVKGSRIYLLDCVWKRLDFVGTVEAIKKMRKNWPEALAILIEDKANGPAVISQLEGTIPGIIGVNPQGSKRARAAAITPLLQAGNVRIPEPKAAWWSQKLMEECAAFPTGRHDDAVDALTQGLAYLMHHRYSDPHPEPKEGTAQWEERMLEQESMPEGDDLW